MFLSREALDNSAAPKLSTKFVIVFPQEIVDSLNNIAGPKRVVIGNGRCLARNLTLALAELLQNKAGFQVFLNTENVKMQS